MKVHQQYNPSHHYAWKDKEGNVCSCMLGQILIASSTFYTNNVYATTWDGGRILNMIKSKDEEGRNNDESAVMPRWSDGVFTKEQAKKVAWIYEKECKILQEKFPDLKLEFPPAEDYEPLAQRP